MKEDILQYIWKYQKFTTPRLKTSKGVPLSVIHPGYQNKNSGPDFETARLKIGDLEWGGNVEIHHKSSDWNVHKHSQNIAYHNTVLHVVWEHDTPITIRGDELITLEMKLIVDERWLSEVECYLSSNEDILCHQKIIKQSPILFSSTLDKMMIERLERKADDVLKILKHNKDDWEETTYRTFASNFGFSTNKYAFEAIAKNLTFKTLNHYITNQQTVEALLFGISGLLEGDGNHFLKLEKEFLFLKKKHNLVPISKSNWKFSRMRPPNFPSIRVAQFATFLHQTTPLFTTIISTKDSKELLKKLHFELPLYWQQHYDFEKKKKKVSKQMGASSYDHLIINSVVPILAAYSKYTDNQSLMDLAIQLLELTKSEENYITKKWKSLNYKSSNAFDSQSMIQLFQQYCLKKRCLSCPIGAEILDR